MKFADFLIAHQEQPYIDSRLFYRYGNSQQIIRNQVNAWQKKGQLVRLKKGLYLFSNTYKKFPEREKIANFLNQPSYLSLQYVLGHYGLIPEAVYNYTSITTKKTNKFNNKLGCFIYHHLQERHYWGFVEKKGILIAEPEKALLDYLYLFTNAGEISADFYINNMRLQNVGVLKRKRLSAYAEKYNVVKIQQAVEELLKVWKML